MADTREKIIQINSYKICKNEEKSVEFKNGNYDITAVDKELATIIRDVDINFDMEKATVELPQMEKVSAFLRKMQFYSFIKNIDKILSSFNSLLHSPRAKTRYPKDVFSSTSSE